MKEDSCMIFTDDKSDFRCTFLGIVYATVIPSGKSGTGPEEFFSSSSETSDTNSIPVKLSLILYNSFKELNKQSLFNICILLIIFPPTNDFV